MNHYRLCVKKIHRYLNVDQFLHHRPVKTAIHHILAGVYNPLHRIWIAEIFPLVTSKLLEVIPIGLMVIMMALVVKAVVLAEVMAIIMVVVLLLPQANVKEKLIALEGR